MSECDSQEGSINDNNGTPLHDEKANNSVDSAGGPGSVSANSNSEKGTPEKNGSVDGSGKRQTRVTRSLARRTTVPSPFSVSGSGHSASAAADTPPAASMVVETEARKIVSGGSIGRLSILGAEQEPINNENSRVINTRNPYSQDQVIRVGKDYQAELPSYGYSSPLKKSSPEKDKEKATCYYKPSEACNLTESELEDFCATARDQFGYRIEQALGLLHWHKYNTEAAFADIREYVPMSSEWTTEDKVVFEQSFSLHGKNFNRIRQNLPHKTVANLVEYYYAWKNTRNVTSYMDRSEEIEESDEDSDDGAEERKACSNCSRLTTTILSSQGGLLCNACHAYFKKTGLMRSKRKKKKGVTAEGDDEGGKKKGAECPPGVSLSLPHLMEFVRKIEPNPDIPHNSDFKNQGEKYLSTLDFRIRGLRMKSTALNHLTQEQTLQSGIDNFRIRPQPKPRPSHTWSEDEKWIAVMAFRRFGKNYAAISDILRTKTPDMVRNFYVDYGSRYKLDKLIDEHEDELKRREKDVEVQKRKEMESSVIDLVEEELVPSAGGPNPLSHSQPMDTD